MGTGPEQIDDAAASRLTQLPTTSSATIDDHLFRINIGTVLSAYLYGHMTEVHALRVIVRTMRERLQNSMVAGLPTEIK